MLGVPCAHAERVYPLRDAKPGASSANHGRLRVRVGAQDSPLRRLTVDRDGSTRRGFEADGIAGADQGADRRRYARADQMDIVASARPDGIRPLAQPRERRVGQRASWREEKRQAPGLPRLPLPR